METLHWCQESGTLPSGLLALPHLKPGCMSAAGNEQGILASGLRSAIVPLPYETRLWNSIRTFVQRRPKFGPKSPATASSIEGSWTIATIRREHPHSVLCSGQPTGTVNEGGCRLLLPSTLSLLALSGDVCQWTVCSSSLYSPRKPWSGRLVLATKSLFIGTSSGF